jgi:hypothetical protein
LKPKHLTSKFTHISVKTVISLSKKYESFEIIIIIGDKTWESEPGEGRVLRKLYNIDPF